MVSVFVSACVSLLFQWKTSGVKHELVCSFGWEYTWNGNSYAVRFKYRCWTWQRWWEDGEKKMWSSGWRGSWHTVWTNADIISVHMFYVKKGYPTLVEWYAHCVVNDMDHCRVTLMKRRMLCDEPHDESRGGSMHESWTML